MQRCVCFRVTLFCRQCMRTPIQLHSGQQNKFKRKLHHSALHQYKKAEWCGMREERVVSYCRLVCKEASALLSTPSFYCLRSLLTLVHLNQCFLCDIAASFTCSRTFLWNKWNPIYNLTGQGLTRYLALSARDKMVINLLKFTVPFW